MEKSQTLNELASALCKCQAQIKGAKADSENPFFKSSYADLASVWEACREPLTKNGLSVCQTIEGDQDKMVVKTILMHISGEFIISSCPVLMKDKTAQGAGSGITYARRYSLAAIVGIAQIDDDGNSASGKDKNENSLSNGYMLAIKEVASAKSVETLNAIALKVKDSVKLNSNEKKLLYAAIQDKQDDFK